MKRLIAILTFAAVTCQAQVQLKTKYFVPTMSASQITQGVVTAAADVVRWFEPGTYIIPTNLISWMRPGITNRFHFNGATVYYGHSSDGVGAPNTPRGLWWDAVGAATLIVTGNGTFISSNVHGTPLSIINAGSKVEFSCNNLIRVNTNLGAPVIYQSDGDITATVFGDIENYGYDGYWYNGTGSGTLKLKVGRIYCADTGIEYLASPTNWHTIEVDQFEKRPTPHDTPQAMMLADKVHVTAGTVNLHSNAYIGSSGFFLPPGVLEASEIFCDTNSNQPLLILAALRVKGANMVGSMLTNTIRTSDFGQIFENCTVSIGPDISATNFAIVSGSGGAEFVSIVGDLRIPRGRVQDMVSLNGRVIGSQWTNSYAGPTVFVHLGHHTHQVLDATNSATLVLTNTAGLESGKEVFLTVYNNKATNMPLTHPGAGYRPMNQVQTVVTNGRSLLLHITRIGTNNHVMAYQQQN